MKQKKYNHFEEKHLSGRHVDSRRCFYKTSTKGRRRITTHKYDKLTRFPNSVTWTWTVEGVVLDSPRYYNNIQVYCIPRDTNVVHWTNRDIWKIKTNNIGYSLKTDSSLFSIYSARLREEYFKHMQFILDNHLRKNSSTTECET